MLDCIVHTTVMGMLGALGKMKATSSNLPRRRQVSARAILRGINYGYRSFEGFRHTILHHWEIINVSWVKFEVLGSLVLPVAQAVGHDDRGGVLLQRGNDVGGTS